MNTNELEAVLGRFDIDGGFAEAWKREWRYRRCFPWNPQFTSPVTIYGRQNFLTTHSLPVQEWLQARQIKEAEAKWKNVTEENPYIRGPEARLRISRFYSDEPSVERRGTVYRHHRQPAYPKSQR